MSWFKRALGLCEHKWAVFEIYTKVSSFNGAVVGHQYHLRCEKCGEIKVRKT